MQPSHNATATSGIQKRRRGSFTLVRPSSILRHLLPGRRAGYRLVADGPPGEEFVIGVASDRPMLDRWNDSWSGVAGVTEFERIGQRDYRVGLVRGDRFRAIDRVSTRLVEVPTGYGRPGTSRDAVSFFIGDPGCRWVGGHGRAHDHAAGSQRRQRSRLRAGDAGKWRGAVVRRVRLSSLRLQLAARC